ncbi:hotdog fold thioesterase [Nocardioides humilatus]|uniref:Hotdog fold thioesterase n=1 Tax=Nocardioides humilatus TaxID=2607660 RepID=A0A5B1LKI4_9ACTN|nr:PaaI family thioesterase [Nocardioides humilatus]KAA1421231.1 hotdog fold thioesterase [Nocardioides humilatus]
MSIDIDLAELATMTGLETMEAIAAGALPPPTIAVLLGMSVVDIAEGRATFELSPDERMLNPLGTVHGGIAATILDSCLGCAVHTTLAPGEGYTTAQLNLHYLRPMFPGMGPVRATGTVIHRGRKQATAEGKLVGPDGKVIAHGTTTCLILEA